ncbi:uncharacterized protein LOC121415656 [Lytechinus variegatus]|uniref:uncharacterized protein LOC121415656 n=1 Tax=Lytechinus variegatus TaxID=7654 RepID=UPI001BB21702|nr:uncharacterized protein LOC121415656 [Lytechinus variegatus]
MGEPARTYIYHSAMLLFSFMGACLNFGSMCAMLLNRELRKGRHVFIFNLALADCASAVAIFVVNFYDFPEIPFEIENVSFSWMVSLFTLSLVISLLSTLAIAVERLLILRVDNYSNRRSCTARLSVTICVIGWIVFPLLYFLLHGFDRIASLTLLYCVSPSVILGCIIFTALSYILIYKRIVTISDNVRPEEAALVRRAKSSKYVIVTFALVVASTTACWVIMCCVMLVEYATYFQGTLDPDTLEVLWFRVLSDVGNVLVCINGILNPTIIWLRLPVFRRQLSACCNRLRCRNVDESQDPALVSSESPTAVMQPSISFMSSDMPEMTSASVLKA